MTLKQIVKQSLAAGLAAAAWLGSSAASASTITGSYDLAFGSAFPNLGFRGSFTVFIPDTCLAQPAGFVANDGGCSSTTMALQSGSLALYNLNTPGQPAVQTLTLDPANFSIDGIVTSFDAAAGVNRLLGISGAAGQMLATFSDPGPLAGAADDLNFDNAAFFLSFQAYPGDPALNLPAEYGASLMVCDNIRDDAGAMYCDARGTSAMATVTFSDPPPNGVPEPQSLALSLLALAVAGVAAGHVRARR